MPMFYVEATHIYKPGNKDEVRLVYRVKGNGESNRHQKSFSIGKYGLDQCWRMANESKCFINTTHRLPQNFLDPWASLHSDSVDFDEAAVLSKNKFYTCSIPFVHSSLEPLRYAESLPPPNGSTSHMETHQEPTEPTFRTLPEPCGPSIEQSEKLDSHHAVRLENCQKPVSNLCCPLCGFNTNCSCYSQNPIQSANSLKLLKTYEPSSLPTLSPTPSPYLKSNLLMQFKKKRGRPPKWLHTLRPDQIQQVFEEADTSSSRISDFEEPIAVEFPNTLHKPNKKRARTTATDDKQSLSTSSVETVTKSIYAPSITNRISTQMTTPIKRIAPKKQPIPHYLNTKWNTLTETLTESEPSVTAYESLQPLYNLTQMSTNSLYFSSNVPPPSYVAPSRSIDADVDAILYLSKNDLKEAQYHLKALRLPSQTRSTCET